MGDDTTRVYVRNVCIHATKGVPWQFLLSMMLFWSSPKPFAAFANHGSLETWAMLVSFMCCNQGDSPCFGSQWYLQLQRDSIGQAKAWWAMGGFHELPVVVWPLERMWRSNQSYQWCPVWYAIQKVCLLIWIVGRKNNFCIEGLDYFFFGAHVS